MNKKCGDNLIIGRTRIVLESAPIPLTIEQIAARVKVATGGDRVIRALRHLSELGQALETDDGLWVRANGS
jgi:hypothetical protein